MSGLIQKLDDSFQKTRLGTYFELEARGSKLSIEFGGAVATFMTTAYILAVNPRILAVRTTVTLLANHIIVVVFLDKRTA